MEPFSIYVSETEIKNEKQKARKLRHTRWWKEKLHSGLCEYCGNKFSPKELTMDHIVPLIRGGKSVKNNIAVCCKECNNKKKYHLPSELLILNSNIP